MGPPLGAGSTKARLKRRCEEKVPHRKTSFSFRFLHHDLTYRVYNSRGHVVATCYMRETAELVADALNAHRPALEAYIRGIL
jgi:hypothetical protein